MENFSLIMSIFVIHTIEILVLVAIIWGIIKIINKVSTASPEKIKTMEKARFRRNIYRFLTIIVFIPILFLLSVFAINIYYNNHPRTNGVSAEDPFFNRQEKEAFNNMFIVYEGVQTSSRIKELLTRAAANLRTYKDEPEKIPTIILFTKERNEKSLGETPNSFTLDGKDYSAEEDIEKYISDLKEMRNLLENKNTYTVKFDYDKYGVVDTIAIGDITDMNESETEAANQILENALINY